MENASLRYGPSMDSSASTSLSRSFGRHLRAKNLSNGTVASYLVGVRQFTAFLPTAGSCLRPPAWTPAPAAARSPAWGTDIDFDGGLTRHRDRAALPGA